MTKIPKLFKALLCTCMLLGGLVFNPMKANAAKEETVTPYASTVTKYVDEEKQPIASFKFNGNTYTNKLLITISGSYLVSTSGGTTTISNINITPTVAREAYHANNLPASYTPYVKNITKTQSGSGLNVTVRIGIRIGSTDIPLTNSLTYEFNV